MRHGPPSAHVGYRKSFVQHPRPWGAEELNPEARWLLIEATLEAVKRTGLRMCVVWGPESSNFCELDGRVNHLSEPPSGSIGGADGGVLLGEVLAKHKGVDVTKVPAEALHYQIQFEVPPIDAAKARSQDLEPQGGDHV